LFFVRVLRLVEVFVVASSFDSHRTTNPEPNQNQDQNLNPN